MTHVIAIYEIDREFGGPEEGGWHYDTGRLVKVLAVRRNEEKANALARRLNGWLRRLQSDRRDVGSVLYDGGRYAAEVYQDAPPPFYPAERPTYS